MDPDVSPEELEATLAELHKSFAFLSQEEQKYANQFLHDVQNGDADLSEGKTFREYIVEYEKNEKRSLIHKLSSYLGVAEEPLEKLMNSHVTEKNLNEYGRFDALKATVVREKAQAYFSKVDGKKLPPFRVNNRVDKLLADFILSGGCEIPDPENPSEKKD
jgi:type I restriction enzyme R subunit